MMTGLRNILDGFSMEMLKAMHTGLPGWPAKYRRFIVPVNAVALIALVGWVLFTLLKASSFPGQPFGYDYGLNLRLSVNAIEGHTFAAAFLYPLPSVLLRYYLFKIFGNFSGIVWVCAMASSMYIIMRVLIHEFYTGEKECRYIYAILALIPVVYYVQWDLRSLNCNLIVLCLVLVSAFYLKKESFFISAFFLSLAVALKLYPVLILAYLLVRKQFRLVASALFWIVIFFVLIPITALGWPSFLEMTRKWIEVVALTGSQDFPVQLTAYKMSLHFALLSLISQGDMLALSAQRLHDIQVILFCLRIFFIISAVIYLIFDNRSPDLKGIDHNLFNMILILVASLLFSEQLQPHHGVFLLAPSLFIMNFSLYSTFSRSVRYWILAIFLLPYLVLHFASAGMEKAFAMNLYIIVYLLLLIFLRFYMTRHELVSSQEKQPSPL